MPLLRSPQLQCEFWNVGQGLFSSGRIQMGDAPMIAPAWTLVLSLGKSLLFPGFQCLSFSFLTSLFSVFEGLYKAILRHQALFPEMLLANK